jgi:mono/diheme cytochrome c family protein
MAASPGLARAASATRRAAEVAGGDFMTRYPVQVAIVGCALVVAGSAGSAGSAGTIPAAETAAVAPVVTTVQAAPEGDTAGVAHREMLNQYCVTCHNQRAQTAGLMLDTLDLSRVGEEGEIWEEAVRKLRGHMMPPPGARQPDAAAVESFVTWLESELDRAAEENPNPGHVALHRLNRTEYANAVREIFGIDIDPTGLLPVDDISDGFDNIASVLKVSPSFLDQYIMAAREVSAQAVGEPRPEAPFTTAIRGNIEEDLHRPGGLPLGTEGMLAEHYFPGDGEYEFSTGGGVRSILTLDGATIFDSDFDTTEVAPRVVSAPLPGGRGGSGGNGGRGGAPAQVVRVSVTEGYHLVGAASPEGAFTESDGALQAFGGGGGRGRGGGPSVEVTGPFNTTGEVLDTPVRQALFVCRPGEGSPDAEVLACAEDILGRVARKAFRRDVTDRDMVAPLAFFRDGRERGDFETGVQYGLMAILASPKFLYRAESMPEDLEADAIFPIDDLELASRLSFFLWSAPPDDELLDLAVASELGRADVLARQVRRMLADDRSKALVTNFAFHWLNLGGIDDIDPDPVLFPEYSGGLAGAFVTELEEFIHSIIREDRSVVDLLTADYTFLNEALASHYGVIDVRGSEFRRVTLEDENRWGLLGKGGVLMVTSYPNRTAPVLRGAWILERILGTPPAAPPPDVEAFPETQEGEAAKTVRERLEAHRANPSCNGCHGVMDPLGFALENFDAIGGWRTIDRYAGTDIDATGQLADGRPVASPADLRQALAGDAEQFVQTFTEKLLMYALGRTVEHFDMPVVRSIVRETADDDYRVSAIVMEIVESMPFRMKQVTDSGESAGAAALAGAGAVAMAGE